MKKLLLLFALAVVAMSCGDHCPSNEIWYTTTDGKKLFPNNTEPAAFGTLLVSNIYKDGQGVLTFDDDITLIGGGVFLDCTTLATITIPESVTEIGDSAFEGCSSLTSVTIPDSVTSIGYGAFYMCSSLTRVTIPDSVTTIGECAFNSCSSLTNVTIPDSVTTIGDYAFIDCWSLTSVTIGDSVTTIGDSAFEYCNNLTSVYCKAMTPPAGGVSMFSNASGRKIYVPRESVKAYKSAEGWSKYADYIVGYDF